MSATGQPYSDDAAKVAAQRLRDTELWIQDEGLTAQSVATDLLDAAHNRERLGLDASVHAASFLATVAAKLRMMGATVPDPAFPEESGHVIDAGDALLREFASEAIGATDDQ